MKKILVLFVLSIACIMGTHAQEGLKWGIPICGGLGA